MKKPTRSKDGWPRYTIRVNFRIGYMEIFNALLSKLENEYDEAEVRAWAKTQTRKSVWMIVRDCAYHNSDDLKWYPRETAKWIEEIAKELAMRLFPEVAYPV